MPDSGRLFRDSVASLEAAGVASPQNDARELFESVLGAPAYMWPKNIDEARAARLQSLVSERARRVPLQHVLGKMWFYGLALSAGPGVFCVRPETEVLAHWAIERFRGQRVRALDLCTGSGALALALAKNLDAQVSAVELSATAAEAARSNARTLGLEIDIVEADALKVNPEWEGSFDLVVSNPPYVPPRELEPELAHDPDMALWGGDADGMQFIRYLIPVAYSYLRPGGVFGMEHDDTQAEATRLLARACGFEQVETMTDLNGRPRFLTAQKPINEAKQ